MSVEISAANRGAHDAVKGTPYDRNPYCKARQAGAHMAWSKSHNAMRAKMAMGRQEAAGPC